MHILLMYGFFMKNNVINNFCVFSGKHSITDILRFGVDLHMLFH